MQSTTEWTGLKLIIWCLLLFCGLLSGCAGLSVPKPMPDPASMPQAARPGGAAPERETQGIQLVPCGNSSLKTLTCETSDAPFTGKGELSVEALIEQVLARNPALAQMVATWQAASARYPQATSLEDPMLAATVGPGTISPDDQGIEFAYRLEISQKLPFPGKLRLRGDIAQAEASAAGRDVDDMRLQLVESARSAFYDYYLVDRALEVNAEGLRLLRDFRKDAQSRYQTGLVPEQDVLQADVEIGKEEDRRLELEQMRHVAVARINTLMHLPPDSPLPPPPKQLNVTDELPGAQSLRAAALARRPDLQAVADRMAAEEAALGLAHKEFYPDFEPFLMYDRFMGNISDNRDLATMLGVRLNLPVYRQRRYGMVAEAEARIAQRRAELTKLTDQVNFQVEEAHARVQRSERSVRLYRDTILKAAEANVKAAQAAYITGKIPFLSLVEAQRNLVGLRDRYYEAVADYFRRRAALERAVGGPLTTALPSTPHSSPVAPY
jgi:outer membrane protein TolC